jgi:hypothetical protein
VRIPSTRHHSFLSLVLAETGENRRLPRITQRKVCSIGLIEQGAG